MRENKNNLAYLFHIRDALEKIITYTTTHDFTKFENNDWDQSAVLRYLEIVGEAANKTEPAFRKEHNEIPWREVTDLRNIIIHDYMNVDVRLIWRIITEDVPKLKKQVDAILAILST